VAGSLVFLWRGRDALAAKFIGIIFAEEDVPLLAALKDFFLLRGDAPADFDFDFFLFLKDVSDGLHDMLANSIAVLDELDFVALDEEINDLVGDTDNFFAAQSHDSV
jgi:hypothetical protein